MPKRTTRPSILNETRKAGRKYGNVPWEDEKTRRYFPLFEDRWYKDSWSDVFVVYESYRVSHACGWNYEASCECRWNVRTRRERARYSNYFLLESAPLQEEILRYTESTSIHVFVSLLSLTWAEKKKRIIHVSAILQFRYTLSQLSFSIARFKFCEMRTRIERRDCICLLKCTRTVSTISLLN